ncbi:MAG TPA: DUF4185 domain-containing protein [Caulifigura sp.]|jgi:hypothetical protein|nr:DUF4185 domain-containing protein [Caulifigura sp.]
MVTMSARQLLPKRLVDVLMRLFPILVVAVSTGFAQEQVGSGSDPARPWVAAPYEASTVITGIEFDASTRRTEAPGSDIWPITWAADGHQYSAFGDGAGFGATAKDSNGRDRVSMGVARITGDPANYVGMNVWGGKAAEHSAQFQGKGTGIISVDGVLFMWVAGPESLTVPETRLAVSRDLSKTWQLAEWKWTMQDRLFAGAFVNHGRDNAGAKDDFIYAAFTRLAKVPQKPRNWTHEVPGQVDLARAPKSRLLEQGAWEWFAGFDDAGNAMWTPRIDERRPCFEDPNGIKIVSLAHNAGLDRYLLVYNPHDNRGHFACFEAPAPWGPWRRVAYLKSEPLFMPPEVNQRVSVFHFAPKWWRRDGREFTLVFNTGDDAWNTVRGRLLTR